MNNKRGEPISNIVFVVAVLFILVIVGLFMVIGSAVINWTFDEAVPELKGLGSFGGANLTSIADTTLTPVNTFVQSFTWLTGVIYVFGLLAVFGLALAFRFSGDKWLAGFFVACMLMLIITCIFISNIYEDFYDDPGDLGNILKEHTILSFMLLYSPMIMCVIGFICGIIMFTGDNEGGFR